MTIITEGNNYLSPLLSVHLPLATGLGSGRVWLQTRGGLISQPRLRLLISVSPKWGCSPASKGLESTFLLPPSSLPQRSHLWEDPGASPVWALLTLSSAGKQVVWKAGRPGAENTPVTSQLSAWGDSGYHHTNDFANFIPFIPIKGSAEKGTGSTVWCLLFSYTFGKILVKIQPSVRPNGLQVLTPTSLYHTHNSLL